MPWWAMIPGTAALVAIVAPSALTAQVAQQGSLAIAVVQAQVEAFNKSDVDAFAALYSDDVELFDLGPETKLSLSGRAALIARYKPMLKRYLPKATVLSRIQSGNFIIDKDRTDAAGQSSEGVAIYQVENGKIRRVWFTP